jgi:Flp pilus assembly protein TadD
VHLREKDFAAAEVAFARALKSDATLNKARVGLGEALVGLGRVNEAIASFEVVLRFDPTDRAARAALNKVKYGDDATLAQRLAELSDAIIKSPTDSSLRLWLGKALAAAGQLEAAKTNFALAVQLDSENAQARYLLGQELARENQFEAAVSHFKRAVELDPNDPEAHFNLGVALARMRRFSEAVEHFEIVLRLDPANKLAREYAEMARSQSKR